MMSRQKIENFWEFLKNFELSQNAADYFKSILDFKLDINLPQRKLVDLGRIIGRIVSANHVVNLETKGFRTDLIHRSLDTIKHEISSLVSSFKFQTNVIPVEDYKDDCYWLDYC